MIEIPEGKTGKEVVLERSIETNRALVKQYSEELARQEEELKEIQRVKNLRLVDTAQCPDRKEDRIRYVISYDRTSGFGSLPMQNSMECPHGNLFGTSQFCKEYAKALNTFLLLRRQPGIWYPTEEEIGALATGNNPKLIHNFYVKGESINKGFIHASFPAGAVSPLFLTSADRDAAIEIVGAKNIIHMFNTFSGIFHK